MASSAQIEERFRNHWRPQGISVASAENRWPRISLVTLIPEQEANGPSGSQSTIRSVLQQGYPNLEYLLVKAGPDAEPDEQRLVTDPRIVRVDCASSSVVTGLNAAFAESTGEIFGWLNAGEMLHAGALFAVGGIFAALPQVEWVTGSPSVFGPNGEVIEVKHVERWSRARFLAGGNKYIHRDTTFWRRSLWEKAGGAVKAEATPEFELFLRFFRHARLYSAQALFGGWRTHPGDFVGGRYREYNAACDEIADRELGAVSGFYAAKAFRSATRIAMRVPVVRRYWHKFVLRSLYRCPGPDWPPKIVHRDGRWQIE